MSWGPIASIPERVSYLEAESPIPGGWDWLGEAHDDFWEACSQPAEDRLVWLSDNAAHEVAGYLAFLERFSDREATVVRPNEHLPPHPTYGPFLGTGTANVEQLANVLENAEQKPLADDHALYGRWAELRSENALLRVMSGKRLVSAPVDTFDRLLLGAATADWQPRAKVVGKALGASFDEQVRISSDFLFSRLAALVRSEVLAAQGDVLGWDEEGRRQPALVRKVG